MAHYVKVQISGGDAAYCKIIRFIQMMHIQFI